MLPTIARLLEIPEIRRGSPFVLAGEASLDREVRWVHVSELPDIGTTLTGGEVILTTGVAIPKSPLELRRYVHDLADAGVAGLFVGLGRGIDECHLAMIETAESRSLPLVEFRSKIAFIGITESVHSLIVNSHVVELRRVERTHETFTTLELEGASLDAILREAATLAQAPMVLEDLHHRVLAYNTLGSFHEDVLFNWEERSRSCRNSDRTTVFPELGWIATRVGARGENWGRLIAFTEDRPESQQRFVVERAASAIAVHRLIERDERTFEQAARTALLTDILGSAYGSQKEFETRAAAVGVKVRNRILAPVSIRVERTAVKPGESTVHHYREAINAVERATVRFSDSVLVAATSPDKIALLVTRDPQVSREEALMPVAMAIHDEFSHFATKQLACIGVASDITSVSEVPQGLLAAGEIADAGRDRTAFSPYLEMPDVHVRGLLFLLRGDHRVQGFIEREIGPLLALSPARRRDLLQTLSTFLQVGRNKSVAADALHMSRPAVYHRLRTIQSLLGVDLDDVEACLSLHLAIVAHEEK